MTDFRDIKRNPYSSLGRFFAVISFGLIILLFLINLLLGGLSGISDYLLYYALPIFLFTSIILLAIHRIKEIFAKHHGRKTKRIRKDKSPSF